MAVLGRLCSCAASSPRVTAWPSPSTARVVPRGSRRPAPLWLAGATGQPILPFHLEADRFWTTKSWDKAQIPKPFSTVAVLLGEPIEVPGKGGEERIERARTEVERALESLEARARRVLLG